MGIQGMELFAIGVVIILFMAVLKQFGILEPISSFEGNMCFMRIVTVSVVYSLACNCKCTFDKLTCMKTFQMLRVEC